LEVYAAFIFCKLAYLDAIAISEFSFNLDSAIERGKEVQDMGVHRKTKNFVVTLLVMKIFSGLLGASRASAYFRDSTAECRFNNEFMIKHLLAPQLSFLAYKIAESIFVIQ
jgi:hypothetical protein